MPFHHHPHRTVLGIIMAITLYRRHMTIRQRIGVVMMLVFAACLILAPIAVCFAAPCDAYRGQIQREAQARFGIPAPVAVIAAQMRQESGCNPAAVSRVGALGVMQFMPKTAEWAAVAGNLGQADPTSPLWAIRAGVWYDRWLFERIRLAQSECDRWSFTLSGYNGGLGYVFKRQRLSTAPGRYSVTGYINPGISPANQHENEGYAPRILYRHQPSFKTWGGAACLD